VETLESISIGTLNILEVLRFHKLPTKFYNASSSECFGDTNNKAANEETPFKPRSPYAVAKSAAFWQVANYREAYNLFACSGILFNHESPLRPKRFVTKKIIETVIKIAHGEKIKLKVGNTLIKRDWGWAPEYIEGMFSILQLDKPDDFVIATGRNTTLEEFIKRAFEYLNLNYKDYIEHDNSLTRPTDLTFSLGDPSKAKKILNWSAKYYVDDVIKMMIDDELGNNKV
jgi:GDPmannose 4,6-dehydratase